MIFERSILASSIALSACSGVLPTSGEANDHSEKIPVAPVVEIAPGLNREPVEMKISRWDGLAKKTVDKSNPVIDRQQKLWDCISKVDAMLLLDCMEDIVASANCYNAGVEKIVDAHPEIKICRQAREARANNRTQEDIFDGVAKESHCIDMVRMAKPDVLNPLNACFGSEIACLQKEIDRSAIICSVEQEDALPSH